MVEFFLSMESLNLNEIFECVEWVFENNFFVWVSELCDSEDFQLHIHKFT